MKKFLTLFLTCSALPVFAFVPPMPQVGTMQGHDMQSIKVQQFRMRELNDMKEVKEEKERYQKMNNLPTTGQQPVVQQMINNSNSEFVEENGKIKIKYMY